MVTRERFPCLGSRGRGAVGGEGLREQSSPSRQAAGQPLSLVPGSRASLRSPGQSDSIAPGSLSVSHQFWGLEGVQADTARVGEQGSGSSAESAASSVRGTSLARQGPAAPGTSVWGQPSEGKPGRSCSLRAESVRQEGPRVRARPPAPGLPRPVQGMCLVVLHLPVLTECGFCSLLPFEWVWI